MGARWTHAQLSRQPKRCDGETAAEKEAGGGGGGGGSGGCVGAAAAAAVWEQGRAGRLRRACTCGLPSNAARSPDRSSSPLRVTPARNSAGGQAGSSSSSSSQQVGAAAWHWPGEGGSPGRTLVGGLCSRYMVAAFGAPQHRAHTRASNCQHHTHQDSKHPPPPRTPDSKHASPPPPTHRCHQPTWV